jgi:hypothetical protein
MPKLLMVIGCGRRTTASYPMRSTIIARMMALLNPARLPSLPYRRQIGHVRRRGKRAYAERSQVRILRRPCAPSSL